MSDKVVAAQDVERDFEAAMRVMPFSLREAIEVKLTHALGIPVQIVSMSRRSGLRSYSKLHAFWRVEVRAGANIQAFHIKCAPAKKLRNRVDEYLSNRNLPVPRYFGIAESAGLCAGIWELYEGRCDNTFRDFTSEEVTRVARAMALIAHNAKGIQSHVSLSKGVKWAEPVSEQLLGLLSQETFQPLRPEIEFFARIERAAINALNSYEANVLTHNDLKAPNVILMENGDVRIVDWDSATIGPHGASLRRFSRHGPIIENKAASAYVKTMVEHGTFLNVDDVRFVMRGQEVFWGIVLGTKLADIRRLTAALKGAPYAFRTLETKSTTKMVSVSKPAPESLKLRIRKIMDRTKGRLLTPIPHPDFAGWPSSQTNRRYDLIAFSLPDRQGTALDIGTHLGSTAHWLEDLGYKVTAIEKNEASAGVAEELRDLCGKSFRIVKGSFAEMTDVRFDIVLALNIFHYFLKTKERFEQLESFLNRLDCETLILQTPALGKSQPNAYRNMKPSELARFVAARTGLGNVKIIGAKDKRPIFKLSSRRQKQAIAVPRDSTSDPKDYSPPQPLRPPVIERADLHLSSSQTRRQQAELGFVPRHGCIPWPLVLPLDWGADPFRDPNWRSKLQHWRMTDPILIEFFRTKRPELLREALMFVLDWHRFHIVERGNSDFAWSDAGTGIRALRLAFFFDRIYSGDLKVSNSEMAILLELADDHISRLKDDSFIAKSNHGLFQVFGLNLLCKTLSPRSGCQEGMMFAASKFVEILASQFDDRGFHREHSPAYHFFARKVIESLGGTRHFEVPQIIGILAAAKSNESWLVFPDGREVRVGDSIGVQRKVPPPAGPLVTLADNRGFLVGDFSTSGYAVVRSPDVSGSSMIFVTGMANSLTHKHADDLSFELFEFGRMIFVDSGKYGYIKDRMRRYVRSSSAHNTISTLESENRHSEIELIGSSLEGVSHDEQAFTISGRIRRPTHFQQRREIVYSPSKYMVIRDHVVAERTFTFISSLHLAPDLVPEMTQEGITIDLGNRRKITAQFQGEGTIDCTRGQKSPLLGWYNSKYGKMIPTSTVRAARQGREHMMIWAIWFDEQWRTEALLRAS